MSADQPACAGCGEPLDPRAAACASCARLVSPEAPQSAVRPNRRDAIVAGGIIGLAAGLLLAVALLFVTSVAIMDDDKTHAKLALAVAIDTIVFGALTGGAVWSASRGKVGLTTFLIVVGIVAAIPVAACDAVGFGQRYPMQL